MKKLTLLSLALTGMPGATAAMADEGLFTSHASIACDAVLGLSPDTRPSECMPSLTGYFSISHKGLSDTPKARKHFLSMRLAANPDERMRTPANDIANGVERCDAASLNAMPARIWASTAARCIGTPERSGSLA